MKFLGKNQLLLASTLLLAPSPFLWAQPNEGISNNVSFLTSPDLQTRQQASQQLVRGLGQTNVDLIKALQTVSLKPDRSFNGPFHLTVWVIGQVGAKKAVRPLIPLIDFQLDPKTMPVGGFGAPPTYYPVAQALVEMGGGNGLTEGIFNRLTRPATETSLRVHAWVLQGTLGPRVSLAMVQDELETSYAALQRIGGAKTSTKTENLERVKELLASHGPLIEEPEDSPWSHQPVSPRKPRDPNNPF